MRPIPGSSASVSRAGILRPSEVRVEFGQKSRNPDTERIAGRILEGAARSHRSNQFCRLVMTAPRLTRHQVVGERPCLGTKSIFEFRQFGQ